MFDFAFPPTFSGQSIAVLLWNFLINLNEKRRDPAALRSLWRHRIPAPRRSSRCEHCRSPCWVFKQQFCNFTPTKRKQPEQSRSVVTQSETWWERWKAAVQCNLWGLLLLSSYSSRTSVPLWSLLSQPKMSVCCCVPYDWDSLSTSLPSVQKIHHARKREHLAALSTVFRLKQTGW